MKIPRLLFIKVKKENECKYPLAKAICDDFIILSRENLRIKG